MPNILIIDDDLHIGNLLEETLQKENYNVSRAYSGTEAKYLVSQEKFDLILLDLMLPGLSGEELLPHIKDVPVIVVSAKIDPANKVDLLLGGAADYVTKPFNMQELLARITVQLRNKNNPSEQSNLSFQEITLHTDTHMVIIKDTEVRLTRTEFAILKLLMLNPGQVVAKLTILDKISEDTPDCTENSLKIHISNLRKKLRTAGGKDYIEAVWGIGFKLTD